MSKEVEESGYKSHHFVPVTYQRRWTDRLEWNNDEPSILMYHKVSRKIIKTITKDQAQKKNLYTKTAVLENVDQKSLEKTMFPIFETSYACIMRDTLDKDELSLTNHQVRGLTNFVFVQSIRSEKEINNTIERRKRMIDKDEDYKEVIESITEFEKPFLTDETLLLEASMIEGLPDFLKRSNLEILIAPTNHNFFNF